ncbi:MAG: HAD-IA family hydrolase [Candidatus Shapirobacteria bacterium]|jgi:phosphoglycolate phosphatase
MVSKKINNVIFDFDGTIAMTMKTVYDIYGEKADKYGFKKIDGSRVEELKKLSAKEFVGYLGIKESDFLSIHKEIMGELQDRMGRVEIKEGLMEVIEELKVSGIRVGIVTSNLKESVENFLNSHRITAFEYVEADKNLWEKGARLNEVISKNGWNKEEVVYVGDESRDVEAAKVAGIKIISVSWGYEARRNLEEAGANWVVDGPEEIKEIILGN